MTSLRAWSTRATNGSSSAPASRAAASRPRASAPRTSRLPPRSAALAHAKMTCADIDLIVLATTTPDETFPATATRVQARLGMTHGAAFDVQAVCTGFIYALAGGRQLHPARDNRAACSSSARRPFRASSIGPTARPACCSATARARSCSLRRARRRSAERSRRPVHAAALRRAAARPSLCRWRARRRRDARAMCACRGAEVFRHAVTNMAEVIEETVAAVGLTSADIDWFVPHQANQAHHRRHGAQARHKPTNVWSRPSPSTATPRPPPCRWRSPRRSPTAGSRPGDLVLLEAMGGGLTWGAALIRW